MNNHPNILLTRIDNRLVHGQVGVTWTKTIGANIIVVADNEVSQNILQQKLMESVAIAGDAEIRFFTTEQTATTIHEATEEQKIFLVVKDIATVKLLVSLRVPIDKINLGNLHYERGKICFNRKVYLTQSDIIDLIWLLDQKIKVYYQDVPGDTIEHVTVEKLQKISSTKA